MNVLRQLTLRNLRLNRRRTIVTVIGVILSAAMICGVSTLVASFQDLLIEGAKKSDGNYHATLFRVPYANAPYITENAYTDQAVLTMEIGFARLEGSRNQAKPYLQIRGYDERAFRHMPVSLKEGRYPEKAGEIVVSEEIFYSGGVELAVGDTLTLDIGHRVDGGERLSQQPLTETEALELFGSGAFTVTGIMHRPRFEAYHAPGFTALAYLDEGSLSAADRVNVSILGKRPKEVFDQVPAMAATAGAESYTYNNELLKWLGVVQNDRANQMIRSIGLIVMLLVVVGSVTVIYNAFAISVSERKKQFGMLSSVGATAKQIRRIVFYEGTVIGLIAIPVGILSGLAGIGVTLFFVNRLMAGFMFSEDIGMRLIVSPETIGVSVLFIALTIFISAYIPAKRASSISPVEAIRLQTDIKIKGRKLRTSRLTRWIYGIEGELALKNLKRNNKRYRATVFSLFISIVLFVSFSSFVHYGFSSSHMYYAETPYDMTLEKQNVPLEEQLELYRQTAALEGVETYSVLRSVFMAADGLSREQFGSYLQRSGLESEDPEVRDSFRNRTGGYRLFVNVIGLDPQKLAQYVEDNGLGAADAYTDTMRPRGILINHNLIQTPNFAEYSPLHVQAGEQLELTELEYEAGARTSRSTIEIGAVADKYPLGVMYTSMNSISLIVSWDVLEAVLADMHERFREQGDYARMYVSLEKGADAARLEEQIRGLDARMQPNASLYISNHTQNQKGLRSTRMVISIFLYGFVSLITLIGVTNIFNTIHTNIALRRREFAMLKSVGLTPGGFNRMIHYESLFYGIKALAYGLPVSVMVSYWMYRSFGRSFDFPFTLPWLEIAICVAGVFVIVFITMLHASSKLKRENIIDALKQES